MNHAERQSLIHSQNFLREGRLVGRLLDRAGIGCRDLVYEIGPGAGAITEQLARRCRSVVAIEKDPQLACMLRRRFAGAENVTIRAGDFLDAALPAKPYKVFASIPFNATAAIIAKLTSAPHPPEDSYLVVQAEAAQRFTGRPLQTLQALLLGPWFEASVAHRFRRTDFTPVPGVDVVLLRLRKRGPPLIAREDAQLFGDFTVFCFTARRSSADITLESLLGRQRFGCVVRELGLQPGMRPAAIGFAQWLELFRWFRVRADARAMQAVLGSERRLKRQQAHLQKVHRTRARERQQGRAPPVGLVTTVPTADDRPEAALLDPTRTFAGWDGR